VEAAKAAIDFLLTTSAKAMAVSNAQQGKICRSLKSITRRSVERSTDQRRNALSNVIHGMPTQEKIDKAKRTIETWIRELEASPAA
jgi:hypothetical protein